MTNGQAFLAVILPESERRRLKFTVRRARALSGRCMPDYAPRESERGLYRYQDRLSPLKLSDFDHLCLCIVRVCQCPTGRALMDL